MASPSNTALPREFKQAGHIAAMGPFRRLCGRYVIVVDDDSSSIRRADLGDAHASDPAPRSTSSQCWSTPLDPRIRARRKAREIVTTVARSLTLPAVALRDKFPKSTHRRRRPRGSRANDSVLAE